MCLFPVNLVIFDQKNPCHTSLNERQSVNGASHDTSHSHQNAYRKSDSK